MRYKAQIYAPGRDWIFRVPDQAAADKLKQAFTQGDHVSITAGGKDVTLNCKMMLSIEFSEDKDPWEAK
jgi:hypothetical protein